MIATRLTASAASPIARQGKLSRQSHTSAQHPQALTRHHNLLHADSPHPMRLRCITLSPHRIADAPVSMSLGSHKLSPTSRRLSGAHIVPCWPHVDVISP